jgi:molybdenum cofactor cytidylyltransferase
MKKLAAIILAAGQSKRMGQPKMLLPWGQTSVLGQVIATFAASGAQEIILVSGNTREAVEAEARYRAGDFPLRCVYNAQHASGEMLSSLQCGLSAPGLEVDAVLIGLGDQPQVSRDAVQKVITAFGASDAPPLIVPSYNLRRGHPWLVQRALWQQLLDLKPPQTLRDFLNALATQILYVESDSSVLKDLDTPEEYQREKP